MKETIVLGSHVHGPIGTLKLDLPTFVQGRGLITGNSGAGKSRLLRRLAEQAFGHVQVIVIDPEGEFATLREKHAFLLAGRTGEVQAEPRAAALLARRIMELHVSAVLDLYDLRLYERRMFVAAFLESLVDLPKNLYADVLVILDEAHLFCPEKDEAASAAAVIDMMTRGRKRGICGVLATQRLSKLDKDAAAEAKNVFIGGISLDLDQKRAAATLGLDTRERLGLRDIPPGQFLAFGPALSVPGVSRFTSGEIFTTHPKAGQRHVTPAPTPDAIQKVAAELADLPQQAEEEIRTLQAAQAKIRALDRELRSRTVIRETEAIEISVLKPADLKRLESLAERVEKSHDRIVEPYHLLASEVGALLRMVAKKDPPPMFRPAQDKLRPALPPPRMHPAVPTGPGVNGLPGVQQKILDTLAELQAAGFRANRVQLGLWSGYTNPRSGGFTEPLGDLKAAGLVAFPMPGMVELTAAGAEKAAPPRFPATSEGIQARILELLPGPERKILAAVIADYPEAPTRVALGATLGYTNIRSGGFTEPLGWLKTRGLITYPGPGLIQATDLLFVEGP